MDGLYWVWRVWLANPTMLDVKAWVAGIGAAVLMWYFLADHVPLLRRGKRARWVRSRRPRRDHGGSG